MGARPPRSPNLFKRTELRRAIKVAHEVGMIVTGIEVSKSGFLLTVDDNKQANNMPEHGIDKETSEDLRKLI